MHCCETSFVYNYVKKLTAGKTETVIFVHMLLFLRTGWVGFFFGGGELVVVKWWQCIFLGFFALGEREKEREERHLFKFYNRV